VLFISRVGAERTLWQDYDTARQGKVFFFTSFPGCVEHLLMAQSYNIDNSQLISLIISYMCGGLCPDNNLELAWPAVFVGSSQCGEVGGPGSRRYKRSADMC